jgi:hypothetical protein
MVNSIVAPSTWRRWKNGIRNGILLGLTMSNLSKGILFFSLTGILCAQAYAQDFNQAGVNLIQDLGTNLNGAGVRVAQAEGSIDTQGLQWEVSPAYVGQPQSLFTYFSNGVSTNVFPNSLGEESPHADSAAWNFYGVATGVATNVAHVDNIDADYFVQGQVQVIGDITNYTFTLPSSNIDDSVVNQSFAFFNYTSGPNGLVYFNIPTNEQTALDSTFDNYAAHYGTLFVSGAADGQPTYVCPPATCYNGIGVGVFEGNGSSVGPTLDNGRCKPDITAIAPGGATSWSAPYVSGAAAILLQAGWRGDGGSDTNSATNMITLKTLLLNGAVKPADWSNSPPSPLDFRYGAGVLNVFNSYEQLAGGKHGYNFSTNIPEGTAHPPVVTAASIPALSGWDFNTNKSSSTDDAVNHYFFNVTNQNSAVTFTLTSTLAWNRHQNKTAINNLELFLYNAANSNLVASSTSVVDNVQHVFVPQLPQGRYDLQVWKAGGGSIVSTNERYALAWAISSQSLLIIQSGTNVCLSWPAYPAGFAAAAASSLALPVVWNTNNIPAPVFTNGQEVIWLNPANSAQFFQLQTPDF